MTKENFENLFWLFVDLIAVDGNDVISFAPSALLSGNCGGFGLELHPSRLMWDSEIVFLCAMANQLTLSVELRFYDGSITIR